MAYYNKTKPRNDPWSIFSGWLFNKDLNTIFPESCRKIVTQRALLSNFSRLGELTIYLNKYFNNFAMMQLSDLQFYQFMKEIIIRFNITPYHFTYFKHHKANKDLKKLSQHFPYMKSYEIISFFEKVKDDQDYPILADMLGLEKPKTKKLTTAEKKEVKKEEQQNNDALNEFLGGFSC